MKIIVLIGLLSFLLAFNAVMGWRSWQADKVEYGSGNDIRLRAAAYNVMYAGCLVLVVVALRFLGWY